MDINRINFSSILVDIPRPPVRNEQTAYMADSSSAAPVNTGGTITPEAQMVSLLRNIDYIREQLEAILINYPPFFPPGSPQRIDLIKKIKGIQEEIGITSIPGEMKKRFSGQQLSQNASDKDITDALESLFRFRDSVVQSIFAVTDTKQPGKVVDIKI
jgi:hypothetical protein